MKPFLEYLVASAQRQIYKSRPSATKTETCPAPKSLVELDALFAVLQHRAFEGNFEMKPFFDKEEANSVYELLSLYKTSEFESPTRSTVQLLAHGKYDLRARRRIAETANLTHADEAHFEFTVDTFQGILIVQCADSGVEPAEETSREYERLVALKYLNQSGQKRRIFYKLLSCQSGVDRSAIMTFKKSKEPPKDAHFAKADKNNPRSAE